MASESEMFDQHIAELTTTILTIFPNWAKPQLEKAVQEKDYPAILKAVDDFTNMVAYVFAEWCIFARDTTRTKRSFSKAVLQKLDDWYIPVSEAREELRQLVSDNYHIVYRQQETPTPPSD